MLNFIYQISMNTIIVNTYIFILNREVQITSPWRLNNLIKLKSSYNIWFFTFHLNDSFSKICLNNSATLMQIILIQIQNFIYSKFTQILEKFSKKKIRHDHSLKLKLFICFTFYICNILLYHYHNIKLSPGMTISLDYWVGTWEGSTVYWCISLYMNGITLEYL